MSADSKPIKVRVVMTVEVDPETWGLEYGDAPSDLRESVVNYVVGIVTGSAAAESGAIVSVTERKR